MAKMTLDMAQDMFRAHPTRANAKRYLELALQYWLDEMIEDTSLLFILHEIRD